MSESYDTPSSGSPGVQSADTSGKVDAAKQEAADLKDTAVSQTKDVLGTAKAEASHVIGEAKSQAKDLYAQTQRELKEQANTQQQRLASGLRSVGDELGSMASNSGGTGFAADLVQQVSARVSGAATWLGDRDPSSVVDEVKRFARRRPATFIVGAAVLGIVVGRLTRALAANAADDNAAESNPRTLSPAPAPELVESDPQAVVKVGADSGAMTGAPLYERTASGLSGVSQEDGDDRPHTV